MYSQNILTTELNVGACSPFSFLHISDTHLTHADCRDDQRKIDLANKRRVYFSNADTVLKNASQYAKEHSLPIVHTGDLIDFVSYKNLDEAKRFCDDNDVFISAGNHEFSLYVGEVFEDEAYRNQSLDKVNACFKNDIRASCRTINGVNLVAIDNSYYLIDRSQLDFLKSKVNEGKPIILIMHVPLYSKELYELRMKTHPNAPVYCMAVPAPLMSYYEKSRIIQQTPDEITVSAYDYIVNEPLIKHLIVGHLHQDFAVKLTDKKLQISTACTTLRKITIK